MSEKEINRKIKKIDGAMAQEGMPLTKELKSIISKCIKGETTTEKERSKMLAECKKIYG